MALESLRGFGAMFRTANGTQRLEAEHILPEKSFLFIRQYERRSIL
jgi:hypothetical protein